MNTNFAPVGDLIALFNYNPNDIILLLAGMIFDKRFSEQLNKPDL
jgi:hypothetical protein